MKRLILDVGAKTQQIVDSVDGEFAAPELTPEQVDAFKERQLDAFDVLTLRLMLNHENRVRALESKTAITAAQFRTALKALL